MSLNDAIDEFREHSPYKFETSSPGNVPGQPDFNITVTVKEADPTPDSWALITGDILTNLRAALDHAVFPHIRAVKPQLARKYIQYPIEDRREQWEPHKPWFEPPVRAVVGASQPYRATDPTTHQLRVLRELVNMDKHRDLVLANYAFDDFHIVENDFSEIVSTSVFITEKMVPGAVVARAHLRLTRPIKQQMKEFRAFVEYGEMIEIPGYSKQLSLQGVMQGMIKSIGTLLDDLEQAGA